MAGSLLVVPCQVDARRAILVVDVAREIPIEVSVVPSDIRIARLLDELAAVLIDILEEEGNVCSGRAPVALEQRVCLAVEVANLWVVELAEVVVVAVDYDRRGVNGA